MNMLKSLRGGKLAKIISGLALGASALLSPLSSKAAGDLELFNGSPGGGIPSNYVLFHEGGGDGSYLPHPFPPSMEIYYEDAESNKYSVAGINLTSNKVYNCILEPQGDIVGVKSNAIAFHILNEFPTNTFSSAIIQTDSGFYTNINDVLAYTRANSNASGYAFINLPNLTNALNGVRYGSVTMRFAPLEQIVASAGENGSITPSGTSWIPLGDTTNWNIQANEGYHVYLVQTNGGTAVSNNLNSLSSTNFSWTIDGTGTIHAVFDINKYIISPSTPENGTITPSSSVEVNHGSSTNFAATADPHYHIFTITQNGNCVYSNPANLGITGTNIFFNNVTNNGSLGVLFTKDKYNLTVNSAHGNTWPGTTNAVPHNTTLEQKITNTPVSISSGLRAVADGYNLSGNSQISGNATNVMLTLTNDATLTWVWATQALFNASSQNGTISGSANGWYNLGNNADVTNTPNAH